jgi:hypothetical protein
MCESYITARAVEMNVEGVAASEGEGEMITWVEGGR